MWLGLLGAGLMGGAVGSLLTLKLVAPKDEQAPASEDRASARTEEGEADAESGEMPPDHARLKHLEHRVSLLTAALSKSGGHGERAQKALDESGDNTEFSDVADPVFEAAVLDIMERQVERKEEEKAEFRAALRTKEGEQLTEQLSTTLKATPAQQEQIASAVTKYMEARAKLRGDDATERPVTRKEWREKMQAINEEAHATMASILDPEQMKIYDALDSDDKLGRGPRRDRERDRADASDGAR